MMVGAILTQNTNWGNVEKAIANLRAADVLTPQGINDTMLLRLKRLIRPSGFYNQKAARLKAFSRFLINRYGGSIAKMQKEETAILRKELLELKGVGPETADSILLYALNRPVFVIDAYTRRIFSRHRFLSPDSGYQEWQSLFMDNLPRRAVLYNEYHALIVKLAKDHCRPQPICHGCPWQRLSSGPEFLSPDQPRPRGFVAGRPRRFEPCR